MSKIILDIEYDSPIWMVVKSDSEIKSFEHSWSDSKIKVTDACIKLDIEIKLSKDEQINLVNCLTKNTKPFIPHWQNLTPNIHRTVQRIAKSIWETACYVDHCLRKSAKGIRLTPLQIPVKHLNQAQAFPVMYWEFSEEEKSYLNPLYESFKPEVKQQYKNGILIPFPVSFDQKTIYLRDEEIREIFDNIDETTDLTPFWNLYGIAWENFAKNKSYDTSILILSTSMETALKWCLQQSGENISCYLIENMPSPSLEKLFDAVYQYTNYNLPDYFRGWLKQLSTTRNFVAHKPRGTDINVLQLVRWFAMGEAILKAIINKENDPLVGCLIEPIGKTLNEHFPPDSVGVVLRREQFQYEEEAKLHVIMDSGESYYFSDNAYKVLSKKKQKFHDVQ